MNANRLLKIQQFIDSLQIAYDQYKKDMIVPDDANVTIMLTPEQLQTLKDLFVDGMQKAIFSNEKERYKSYETLYENIFFQVAAELLT